MPPTISPARRVLGEKDVNASINIHSPRKGSNAETGFPSLASAQIQSKVLSKSIGVSPGSPRIGQKRRIAEVEGIDVQEIEEDIRPSQATDVISDSASESGQMETDMSSSRSAVYTTMTSLGQEYSQENVVEQQFELPEPEMSQRTLDKMVGFTTEHMKRDVLTGDKHAVTLPQNTSQPSQLQDRPELTHNISQDSVGMSAFLNFHSDASSQSSQAAETDEVGESITGDETVDIVPKEAPCTELSEDEQRKALMQEKAAQLRTRLQLAFFKVETRQTHTPFSRLKVPRVRSQSPPSIAFSHALSHKQQSHSISVIPATRAASSPESYVAARRAEATGQHKPTVRSLNSLPVPKIHPTAYSARWAEDTAPRSTSRMEDNSHAAVNDDHGDIASSTSSSPPLSNTAAHDRDDNDLAPTDLQVQVGNESQESPLVHGPRTPAVKRNVDVTTEITVHSDNDGAISNTAHTPASKLVDSLEPRERRLTSSVVKGEAASGLLQLMRSGAIHMGNMKGSICGL